MSREMKDSEVEWIGKIPVAWQMMPSGSLFSTSKEKASVNDEKLSATQLYGVIPQKLFEEKGTRQVVSVNKNFENLKRVSANSFVISLRSFQGGIELSRYNGAISAAYTVLRPNSNINHEYYKYLFKSQRYIQAIQSTIIESVREGKSISYGDFKLIKLPLLSFNEQGKIANFLDEKIVRIDSIMENTKSTIENYKLLKQSIITEVVTKGLDKNAEMKDSGIASIGEVPCHWKIDKMKNITTIAPKCNTTHLIDNSDVAFAPMETVKNGYFIPRITKFSNNNSSYNSFENGDIVIAKVTPCFENGNIAIMDELPNGYGFGSSELFVLRPTNEVNRGFLFYFLQNSNFINEGASTMTGAGGLKRVSSYFMRNQFIFLPSEDEQRQISIYLDETTSKIDKLINKKEHLLDDLEGYKKSLIFEYVTGKKEVL